MGVTAKRLTPNSESSALLMPALSNCNEIVIKPPLKLRLNADQFEDFMVIY